MKPLDQPLDILVVAPHPDDAEISVGGTICQSLKQGLRVGVLELTNGEPTPHGSIEIREQETNAATKVMQLSWRHQLGLPNRSLQNDLDSRREVSGMFRLTRPQIVLAPYWEDAHPDHVAASQLIDDARFWSKLSRSDLAGEPFHPSRIYYYFSVHLKIHPSPSFVIDISETLEQKMKAIQSYESQVFQGRSQEFPSFLDDIRDRARYWGWTIGTKYGEPFASRECIGLNGLQELR